MIYSDSSLGYGYIYESTRQVTCTPSKESKSRDSSAPSSDEKTKIPSELKPVSKMPLSYDLVSEKQLPEDYEEKYIVDVGNIELEKILEGAEGRIEVNSDIVTRYMPECTAKSEIPFFLNGKWFQFLEPHYYTTGLSHGILFNGRRTVVSPDMNLFNKQTRQEPSRSKRHMLSPDSHPAPNWCLEVEWENEANLENKGYDKVQRMFTYTGANETDIDEIWLLIDCQDNGELDINHDPNPLPIIPLTQDRPEPGSAYFAIFIRNLDLASGYVYANDQVRPLLVGYYIIHPNMIFQVPTCSLLNGVPDIHTNDLFAHMGYDIRINDAPV